MESVGYLYDDSILPVIGNDPYTQDKYALSTACEVYQSTEHKLVVVQQRSPLVKGKRNQFVTKLAKWLKVSEFSQVVLLTSTFSHERLDVQMIGCQERFLATKLMEEKLGKKLREELKWKELEKRPSFPAPAPLMEQAPSSQNSTLQATSYLPGGGIAKSLLEECEKMDIPLLVVSTFCSEGDNVPDALRLASHLNTWLHLVKPGSAGDTSQGGWVTPSSWQHLFGSTFDQMLYQ
ncbi:proteasome assembly chaperone 2 isoform X2 [Lingula anatina]|nr:proteasome assembly chaperone 2 isoform X2 [Lingula anatina]|eukprot:XP_013407431.1 proteasome assembly chaperone 2 isoform X2 [Lingula anatina]